MPPPGFDAVSCGAVVFRRTPQGTRYLLLQYNERHWDFPKGHMEAGETEEQTLRRETMEETGIKDLVLMPEFRTWISYAYPDRNGNGLVRKKVVFFAASTKTEQVTLSHEHIGFEWLPYAEAMRRLTFPKAKRVFRKAYLYLEKQGEV